jgi:hypothetical protein
MTGLEGIKAESGSIEGEIPAVVPFRHRHSGGCLPKTKKIHEFWCKLSAYRVDAWM